MCSVGSDGKKSHRVWQHFSLRCALGAIVVVMGAAPTFGQCIEQQKLTASDGAMFYLFGSSIAVYGDTTLIGVPRSGSVYVFQSLGGVWKQTAKLTPATETGFLETGISVALSGDTAVIAVFEAHDPGNSSGSAQVFQSLGGVWTQVANLTAANGTEDDQFGWSVGISGDTTLIGAPFDRELGCDSGSAYVFEKLGGVWTQTAKLTATDGAVLDWFGFSVAVSGDTAVIGAPSDDDACPNDPFCRSGSAYVFEKLGGVWGQTAKLTAADGAAFHRFGISVAFTGEMAVIGASSADGLESRSGSAYVFEKIAGVWTQTAKLTSADGAASDRFGWSVAVSGPPADTVVIGAPFDDDACPNDPVCASGSAYVFDLDEPCCGDGILDPGEECDGINDAACPGGCLSDCTCGPFCGDGTCDPGERSCNCSTDCGVLAVPTVHLLADNFGVLKENRKGRMLPVVMEDIHRSVAIEVEFVDLPPPYDLWNGARFWAGAPVEVCEAAILNTCKSGTYLASLLSCNEPLFLDWSEVGVVNLWHEGIVPSATYRVRVVEEGCPLLEANFSEPLAVTTAIFGDVIGIPGSVPPEPVDDSANVADALAGIAAFANASGKPSKSRTELAGRCVDHKANINDVLRSLMGFAGLSYPETPVGLDPCATSCPLP